MSYPIGYDTSACNHLTVKPNTVKHQIGKWYDACEPRQIELAKQAYHVISRINNVWYHEIDIPVIWTENDPYDSYQEMKERVKSEGRLYVFSGGSDPKYMSKEDNIRGRAVHDYFGHLEADCDFSFCGEFSKWYHVKDRYPEYVRTLLFTEIVGQRAAASYYDGFTDPRFIQKPAFAPDYIINMTKKYCGVCD